MLQIQIEFELDLSCDLLTYWNLLLHVLVMMVWRDEKRCSEIEGWGSDPLFLTCGWSRWLDILQNIRPYQSTVKMFQTVHEEG